MRYTMTLGGCGGCVCAGCLYYNRGFGCPLGGKCHDDWRAAHDPWPGPVRTQWSSWDQPGEQAHWCRGGIFYGTRECGHYIRYDERRTRVRTCVGCNVITYQDGQMRCGLVETIGCEECLRRYMPEEE